MNAPRALAVLLGLLVLTPVALASVGPFSGTLRQNQARTHDYDNNPDNHPCIQVMVSYTVTLAYTPTTDVLTLSAGGQTATGANGSASVTFMANACTSFTIGVSGTQVADRADYTVTVTEGAGEIA